VIKKSKHKKTTILTIEDSRNIYLTNEAIAIYPIDKLK